MKVFSTNEKGQITVLGSDLPSLIPIVVALVVFFGMLQFSINTVSTRNAQLELGRQALQIGEVVRGDGLSTFKDFGNNGLDSHGSVCEDARSIPGTFVAGVLTKDKLDSFASTKIIGLGDLGNTNLDTVFKLRKHLFTDSDENIEFCKSENLEVGTATKSSPITETFQRIVFIYPTIYQNPQGNISDLYEYRYTAVITWK